MSEFYCITCRNQTYHGKKGSGLNETFIAMNEIVSTVYRKLQGEKRNIGRGQWIDREAIIPDPKKEKKKKPKKREEVASRCKNVKEEIMGRTFFFQGREVRNAVFLFASSFHSLPQTTTLLNYVDEVSAGIFWAKCNAL